MKDQLQQAELQRQILQQEPQSQPLGSDSELQQKLEQAVTSRKEAEDRAELAEDRSRRMEERLQLAKTTVQMVGG